MGEDRMTEEDQNGSFRGGRKNKEESRERREGRRDRGEFKETAGEKQDCKGQCTELGTKWDP